MIEERPLCSAQNNSCTNLASYRETRNGKRTYHTKCDTHRRNGHAGTGLTDPSSKRYIPLEVCNLCSAKAQDRHRIIPGSRYDKNGVLTLCKGCHNKIHRFYKLLKDRKISLDLK